MKSRLNSRITQQDRYFLTSPDGKKIERPKKCISIKIFDPRSQSTGRPPPLIKGSRLLDGFITLLVLNFRVFEAGVEHSIQTL